MDGFVLRKISSWLAFQNILPVLYPLGLVGQLYRFGVAVKSNFKV